MDWRLNSDQSRQWASSAGLRAWFKAAGGGATVGSRRRARRRVGAPIWRQLLAASTAGALRAVMAGGVVSVVRVVSDVR
eukprot:2751806-Lingulodinium_polyedra.AAC.1